MRRSETRIVGISSSPRRANTELLVKHALAAARERYGVSTEYLSFKDRKILPCDGCMTCARRRSGNLLGQCVIEDDWKELIRLLIDPVPNGVIIGSPVYFFDANASLRAFMERCTSLFKACWYKGFPYPPPNFTSTAAGAVAVGGDRHGGQETALSTILNWFILSGFVVVGSFDKKEGPVGYIGGSAWTKADGVGGRRGVLNDEWGMRAARIVGERVAKTAILLTEGTRALHRVEP